MPRLFTGIQIPDEIAGHLCRLQGGLSGARWVASEDYHITLRFLGDVSGIEADDYVAKLDEINMDPFTLTIEGLGAFGKSKPRSIHALVQANRSLDQLQQSHERAAVLSHLAPEGQKFTPHVTVARFRHGDADQVARYLSEFGDFGPFSFEVSEFQLFSSRQSRGGGPYIVEERFFFS